MIPLLLEPWPSRRVLANEGGFLAVDKPSGLVVHGGDERLSDDLVTRLARYRAERGESEYLAVHQRLDKDASGAIVFVTDPERNRAVADSMQEHSLERSYVAGVNLTRKLPDSGVFENELAPSDDGRVRIVASGGKPARAHYEVLERSGERALVRLRPETGRTHQLRVQLAAAGAPIAGDSIYGVESGATKQAEKQRDTAPRLLLHAERVSLAEPALGFDAPVPSVFSRWLARRERELSTDLEPALRDAALLRYGAASRATAFRLVSGAADDLFGVVVDLYEDWATLNVTTEQAAERAEELAGVLAGLGVAGVYLKQRVRGGARSSESSAPERPLVGEAAPAELVVREGELRFLVSLASGLSTGLFVDQRANRERVFELASGRRMLNLFSYTCSFGVAAAKGGARFTTNVDVSGRSLEVGRENYALNDLDPKAHGFVKEDAATWLERAGRKGEKFDLVVLDPPSFGTDKQKKFSIEKDYAHVAGLALRLLTPGGKLFAITNHRGTSRGRLRRWLRDAAEKARRNVQQLKDLAPAADTLGSSLEPESQKSVLLTVA